METNGTFKTEAVIYNRLGIFFIIYCHFYFKIGIVLDILLNSQWINSY